MAKITSPIEGFTGRADVGPHVLEFKDGTAEFEGKLPDGVKAYLLGAGYKVGSTSGTVITSLDGAPVADASSIDARDYADPTQVGTKLRDAAVDPHKDDFLAPTNAGEANPHGPEVVSPEIHASQGVRPVKGGEVHVDDPAKQDEAEKDHATNATDGTPITPVADEKRAAKEAEAAESTTDPEPLKGSALDEALDAAGLSKSGTADEKRQRLAEHQA